MLFLWSFFWFLPISRITSGLILFITTLLRSITHGPEHIRKQYKKHIIRSIITITLAFAFLKNLYRGFSFFVLIVGILHTLKDLWEHKYQSVKYSLWAYCVYAGFSMVYFLGFAAWSNLIGTKDTLALDCKDIYRYYQQVTSRIKKPEKHATPLELSRSQKLLLNTTKLTEQHPSLQSLVERLKGYQKEISSSIVDQQTINQEICALVSNRINSIYAQSNIKVGLIILIGLFFYPFFIILFYVYGFVAYCVLLLCIHYGLFKRSTIQIEKTILE